MNRPYLFIDTAVVAEAEAYRADSFRAADHYAGTHRIRL